MGLITCNGCWLGVVPGACEACPLYEKRLTADDIQFYPHLRPEDLHGRKRGDVIYYTRATQDAIEEAKRRGVALIWGLPPKVRKK